MDRCVYIPQSDLVPCFRSAFKMEMLRFSLGVTRIGMSRSEEELRSMCLDREMDMMLGRDGGEG